MAVIGDKLYFAADDAVHGNELWRSDGTEGGTHLVKDIEPGSDGSYPANLTALNGEAYFSADSTGLGRELWRSDGTPTGTTLLRDIYPGPSYSYPESLNAFEGHLYFTADDPTTGIELWSTDGVVTERVADILPGHDSSYPGRFIQFKNSLYFEADDGIHGDEIWRLARPAVPAPPGPPATPQPPAKPSVKIRGKKVKLDAKNRVKVKLSCATAAKCRGKLTLQTAKKVAAKKGVKKKRVTLGKKSFSIPAGKTVKITLKLKPKMAKLVRTERAARMARAKATLKGAAKPANRALTLVPAKAK